jgi:hypothetical protein
LWSLLVGFTTRGKSPHKGWLLHTQITVVCLENDGAFLVSYTRRYSGRHKTTSKVFFDDASKAIVTREYFFPHGVRRISTSIMTTHAQKSLVWQVFYSYDVKKATYAK